MSALPQELRVPEVPPPSLEALPSRPPRRFAWTRERIAAAAAAIWVASGIYIVLPDQQAVETLFGKVTAARVMPGLHYSPPWPIQSVTRLKVRQLQRIVIGGGAADGVLGRTQPLISQFLTGDQNIINVRVVVQYSVSTPVEYLFGPQNPAQLTAEVVEAEMARRIAHRGVDDVLTTAKIAIQDETRAASQALLNRYRAGVLLSSVNIESVTPPPDAADAFRDVASARADTARIVNDAQGYANDLVPKARGQAQQLHEAAEAYRQRKIDEAAGDAARFNQIAAEYKKAPQVTSRRLYIEAMEQVLPRIRKVIVDPNGNLDLTVIRKGDKQ